MTALADTLAGAFVSLLFMIVALSVVPFLLRVLLPVVGDPIWRGYWLLVRLTVALPFRLAAALFRRAGDRRRESRGTGADAR